MLLIESKKAERLAIIEAFRDFCGGLGLIKPLKPFLPIDEELWIYPSSVLREVIFFIALWIESRK